MFDGVVRLFCSSSFSWRIGEKMQAGRVMSPYITFGSFKNRADGTNHGAELNFRLFQARFLIRLSAIIDG
jgi:hypothetical protein